jgi:hypothetical protein
VDPIDSVDDTDELGSPSLLCLMESLKASERQNQTACCLVSVCLSTGEVIWDEFEGTIVANFFLSDTKCVCNRIDNAARSELDVRYSALSLFYRLKHCLGKIDAVETCGDAPSSRRTQ